MNRLDLIVIIVLALWVGILLAGIPTRLLASPAYASICAAGPGNGGRTSFIAGSDRCRRVVDHHTNPARGFYVFYVLAQESRNGPVRIRDEGCSDEAAAGL